MLLDNIEICSETSGTPGYMVINLTIVITSIPLITKAPELYVKGILRGSAAEWWSVGVTLHEMVTGYLPFKLNRFDIFRSITNKSLEECDNLELDYLNHCQFISDDCKDLIRKLLLTNVNLSILLIITNTIRNSLNIDWDLILELKSLKATNGSKTSIGLVLKNINQFHQK